LSFFPSDDYLFFCRFITLGTNTELGMMTLEIKIWFKKRGSLRENYYRVMSPLVRGPNPRDPTKQLILNNKALIVDILANKA